MNSIRLCTYLFLWSVIGSTVAGKDVSRLIKVIDDEKKPIESEINLLSADGASRRLGKAKKGILSVNSTYSSGDRIHVKPDDDTYFEDDRTECPLGKETIVKVTRMKVQAQLKGAAESAEKSGRYGEAALVYQEMTVRAKGYDKGLASKCEVKVYENLGKKFDVKTPVIKGGAGGKSSMSPELHDRVKAFQLEKGFSASGRLDYKTMEKIGGVSIGKHINK